MEKLEFHLAEVPRIRGGLDSVDFCLVFIRDNKRRVYLMRYPVFEITTKFDYFRRILFN